LLAAWREGALKQRLLVCGLDARRRFPALFAVGDYQPLAVTGGHRDHLLAFARRHGDQAALVVVPRRVAGLLGDAEVPLVPPERWEDAAVLLPEGWADLAFRDVLSGAEAAAPQDGRWRVADLLARFPVALLLAG
jgi:(1->4)-alpha-D-glucan 1-alpha-D-glucosylmutase